MTLQEFIDNNLRIDLDDLGKLVYSDYQLISDTNVVLNVVNNILTKLNSDLIRSTATVVTSGGVGSLPSDFIRAVYIDDGAGNEYIPLQDYTISGDKIYTTTTASPVTFYIQYRPYLTNLTASSTIIYPDWFMDYINRFIIMVVKKEISKADQQLYQLVENDVKFILAGREMPYIYRDPPFFI